ncbi:MAG: hypothetical protein H0X17_07900 [Deltaproteobacteria bacterium]|nr:hypothetical protein [Deltaproteobacteria bacterium]
MPIREPLYLNLVSAQRTIRGWFRARRIRRQLREAAQWGIGTLPEDTCGRITGTVHAFEGQTLEAPISGRPCVYYLIVIEENLGVGGGGAVMGLAERSDGTSFVLEEDGHRAVVDPEHAVLSVAFDHETTSLAAFDADPRQRKLLSDANLIHRDWFKTSSLRYREAIIEIGERVSILGAGVREPDPDAPAAAAYRSNAQTRIRLTSSPHAQLVISDDPRSV